MTRKREPTGTPPKKTTIRHTFQHQDRGLGYSVPHSVPTPQHGQEGAKEPIDHPERPTYKPRPAH